MSTTTLEPPVRCSPSRNKDVPSYPWTLNDIISGRPPPPNQPPDDDGNNGQGNGKGEYIDLVDFAISLNLMGLELLREKLLTRSTAHLFRDNTFEAFRTFLSTELYHRDGYVYPSSLGSPDAVNPENIVIYIHYPTALGAVLGRLLVGQIQHASSEAIKNKVPNLKNSFVSNPTSRSDLEDRGYDPLNELTDEPGQWVQTIFDNHIKPYLLPFDESDFTTDEINSPPLHLPPGP